MIQEKTQKKVLKVIAGLKGGKSLSDALKAAKMTRGHYYSARDGMLRDGNQVVRVHVQADGGLVPTPKKNVIQLSPPSDVQQRLHTQALRENERLKLAEELIEEIKGTQKRQAELLKKLMA